MIGLGARTVYSDGKKNLELKLVAYRRNSEEIRKCCPDFKLGHTFSNKLHEHENQRAVFLRWKLPPN